MKKILIFIITIFVFINNVNAEILGYDSGIKTCVYYSEECYNTCLNIHSGNGPLAYESLCKEDCCKLYKDDLDKIIYSILLLIILLVGFFIYKRFYKK